MKIAQTRHPYSREWVRFTSACFAFAVGYLFISFASLPEYAEYDGAAFPKQGPLQSSLTWQLLTVRVAVIARKWDWQEQGPYHLSITVTLWWHKLKTCVLPHTSIFTSQSVPACFQLNLLLNWSFSPSTFSSSHAFQGGNALNLHHPTTSLTHVLFILFMGILLSPFRPAFSPFNSIEITSSKQSLHWKLSSLKILIWLEKGNFTAKNTPNC